MLIYSTKKYCSWLHQFTFSLKRKKNYRISRPMTHTFPPPEKCDLNLTCVLCAEGKYYFRTYKYPYIFYMKQVTHRVKTTMKMILVAVMTNFWVSMMNKLYYGCSFWYVTILFPSNKLLKIKIHS